MDTITADITSFDRFVSVIQPNTIYRDVDGDYFYRDEAGAPALAISFTSINPHFCEDLRSHDLPHVSGELVVVAVLQEPVTQAAVLRAVAADRVAAEAEGIDFPIMAAI
jgi:hypothetical protein